MKQNRNSGGNRRGGGNQGNASSAGQQAGASTRQMVAQLYEMLSLERPSGQELSFLGFMQEMHKMFGIAQIRPLYTAIAQAWLDNGYQPANFEMVWTILYDKYRMISKIQALGASLPASTIEAEPAVPQFVPVATPAEHKPNVPTPQPEREASEPMEPQAQPKEQAQGTKDPQQKPAGQSKDKERKQVAQPQTAQSAKAKTEDKEDKAAGAKEAEVVPATQSDASSVAELEVKPVEDKESKPSTPPATSSKSSKEDAETQASVQEPAQDPKELAIPRAGTRFREWCYMGKSSRSEILMRTGLPIFSKGIGESYLALYQRVFGEALPENNSAEPISPEQAQRYAARVSILVNYVQDLFASITKSDQPERFIIRSASGEWLAFNSCLRGADGKEIFFVLSRNNFKASFPVAPWEVKEFASAATLLIEFTRRPSGVLDGIYSSDDLDKLTDLIISGGPSKSEPASTAKEEVAKEDVPATTEEENKVEVVEPTPQEEATPSAESVVEPAPLFAPEDESVQVASENKASEEVATTPPAVDANPSSDPELSAEGDAPADAPEAKPKRTSRSKSATSTSKAKATTASKSKSTTKKTASSASKKASAKAASTPSEGGADAGK